MQQNPPPIIHEVKDFWGKISSFFTSGDSAVLNYDDPSTYADNIGRLLRFLYFILAAAALVISGWVYYHTYGDAIGIAWVAIALSILFAAGIEILKWKVGVKAVCMFTHGAMWEGIAEFCLTLFLFGLTAKAFIWDYRVNTAHLHEVAEKNAHHAHAQSDTTTLPDLLAAVDARYADQLTDYQKTRDAGASLTWANKVTDKGQETIQAAEKGKSEIIATITAEKEAITADYNRRQNLFSVQTTATAARSAMFGGIIQILQAILLMALGFAIRIVSKKQQQAKPTPDRSSGMGFRFASPPPLAAAETHSRPVIKGFVSASVKQAETVVATTVSAPPPPDETRTLKQPETTTHIIHDDLDLTIREKIRDIQRYLAKWNSPKGGQTHTISQNIEGGFGFINQVLQLGQVAQTTVIAVENLRERWQQAFKNGRPNTHR